MIKRQRTRLFLMVAGGSVVAVALAAAPRSDSPSETKPPAGPTRPDISTTQPLAASAPSTSSTARPASKPSTAPSAARTESATPFPVRFGALLTRSVFVRGQQSAEAILAAQKMTAGGKEAGLVFRGVGLMDGRITAYLEDVASKRFLRHHQGDAIAGGRIAAITLNDLQFELGGQTKAIALGQNLAGAAVAAPPPPATSQPATAPGGGRPGGPNKPGGPRPPGGVNPEQQQQQMQFLSPNDG